MLQVKSYSNILVLFLAFEAHMYLVGVVVFVCLFVFLFVCLFIQEKDSHV